MAKVSICIPAYNHRAGVERLLESIEQQTFRDFEVILTDDSDGEEIRQLAEQKAYIQYYKNKKKLGATANWNAAIAACSGEYIKIMHHDDWFTDPESLASFVGMMESHPRADLVFSGSRQVEADCSYDRHISEADVFLIRKDFRHLFLGNTIGAPSAVMVRRRAKGAEPQRQEDCLYDEALTWLVDMEYYMGILQRNPVFAYTKEPLVSIGISACQLTEQCREDRSLHVREYRYIYKKYGLQSHGDCRQKLCRILADGGCSFREAADCGIAMPVYGGMHLKKLWERILWKLTHLPGIRHRTDDK